VEPEVPKILIVDDLEMNRSMLRIGLERNGFSVDEAEDAATALRMLDEQVYETILLDIMMPGMSGKEALPHIRARHDANELPVIMVTAFDDPREISSAIANGANDYVTKPVDIPVMIARIRAHIDRKRAIDDLKTSKDRVSEQVAARTADLETINNEMSKEIAHRRELEAELREAKRRAEAANRAKSDFLATMSHELRTPLNSIIGFSDLIKIQLKMVEGGERLDEYATYINDGGNHLLGIVSDILDLSKIDAGRTVLNESHVEISDLLDRSVRMTDAASSKHEVNIHLGRGLQAMDMFCDEILIRRALVNMVGNAVKFSDPGSRIDVTGDLDHENRLIIGIQDEGIGIAGEDIAKVMEPFGQANSELSRSHVGTGLGVPLTKSLIELHGGEFELTSEPGVGTTIRLILPNERLRDRSNDATASVA
jgi:signal transduction histidine kinase